MTPTHSLTGPLRAPIKYEQHVMKIAHQFIKAPYKTRELHINQVHRTSSRRGALCGRCEKFRLNTFCLVLKFQHFKIAQIIGFVVHFCVKLVEPNHSNLIIYNQIKNPYHYLVQSSMNYNIAQNICIYPDFYELFSLHKI